MRTLLITMMITAGVVFAVFFVWATFQVNNTDIAVEEPQEEIETHDEPKELLPINLSTTTVSGIQYRVAEPFNLYVAADELGKARFIDISPDGRLFVPDMVDYQLSREGKITILENFNEGAKRFEIKHTYLSGLRGPNSVAFYRDESGQDWLYLALTKNLIRYRYNAGDTKPSGEPEVIIEFPNTQAENAKSVVWHITRTLLFDGDKLYVSIGSGCNSCEHAGGELRGMVMVMNPDGSGAKMYANGLRNAVGMTFADETMYVTENGADHLGWNAPDEMMYTIIQGEHYGWPYCYESGGEIKSDNSVLWEEPINCDEAPRTFVSFEPHSAPLGIEYFENAHGTLQNTFLVALHGSFDPEIKAGYKIMRVTRNGEKDVFMDGFQNKTGERFARPVDFLEWDENSFFFTDDFGGKLYYVSTQ